MGQYFSAILANPEGPVSGETVSAAVSPDMLGCGLKLMEHGFVGNVFVSYVEELLLHDPQKVVWAGDYADDESSGANLYLFTGFEWREAAVFRRRRKDMPWILKY